MKFEIVKAELLEQVPSASGIVKTGNSYYVAGDDSPYLFCYDHSFTESKKIRIFSVDKVEGDRITKKHKPDFEAMEKVNEHEIAIFGSGSKSPQRDFFIRVLLKEDGHEVKTNQISAFYEKLKELDVFRDSEFNIEAAAEYHGQFFLFNRKKNVVIKFKYEDFVAHIENDAPPPEVFVAEVTLPEINGLEAGFSGATAFPNMPFLIFTASVEDTDNAYDDGDVLGSFIGVLDMENYEIVGEMQRIPSPNEKGGEIKVESVAIDKIISEKEFELVLTTDSDGGDSLIIRGKFSLE
ncbi:hypothetical protein HC174_03255 [Salinimicrobium sp. CDJ15-81-2]|nr:hypothetical protein [Salinimicrobium nanhaiense]